LGNMDQNKASVDKVKIGNPQWIETDVVLLNLKVGPARFGKRGKVGRVDVGHEHMSGSPNSIRHPRGDRTTAGPDFEARPTGADARRLQEPNCARIVQLFQAVEPLPGLGGSVVENVLSHCLLLKRVDDSVRS
jgi:hypothetical protein